MAEFPSEVDIAVIGAGAAGVGAGRRLAAATASFALLEARERIGGRTWTRLIDGIPSDFGGEWLHSADRNAISPLAEPAGFSLYKKRPEWTTRLRNSGCTLEEEADWLAAREAHRRAMRRAAEAPEDRPASTVLVPGGRWNPLFEAISTWGNAVELEKLSIKDNVRYEDSGLNWRVREGYGALIAALGSALPVAFGAAALRIDHRGTRIRIETARGVLRAARVIVAVPTPLIASEALRFDPVLPGKIDAAAGLPLGLANKLFFRFDHHLAGIAGEIFAVGSTRRRETMNYQLRPLGRPRVNCFFGGEFAARLEREGLEATAAFAGDELAALYGNDIRRHLVPLGRSTWHSDEWARGSYSYAMPGHAGDRARLAAPVDERIFFAGEACSPNFFSTAHGAYETGLAAAEAALTSLRPRVAATS